MKKKTILLSTLLLLITSLSLYSAEAVEAPGNTTTTTDASSVSDAEWGWPEKFKISYKWFTPFKGFLKFHIIGKVLSYDDRELIYIVSLTDEKTKKRFNTLKFIYKGTYGRMSKKEIMTVFQDFQESFNAFLTSGSPETARLKEYLKRFYFRERAREKYVYKCTDYFIGVNALLGCDLGIGLKLGFFLPAYKNLKLGFYGNFIYRKNFNGLESYIKPPVFLGGDLMVAIKIKEFYMAGGGFLHFRLSSEIVKGPTHTFYVNPRDYGIITSIDTNGGFKWFAGLTFRYSFQTSKDEYYKQTGYEVFRQGNLSLEAGIGF
jgi:hypothetical protein